MSWDYRELKLLFFDIQRGFQQVFCHHSTFIKTDSHTKVRL